MIIGLLGDTHGRTQPMADAMKLLAAAGAQHYIHTGDVGAVEILDYLAGVPSAFVFGNNDWDRASMSRYAEKIGVSCYGNFADLTLDNKRIAVIHGDDPKLKQRILADQQFDYLFQGHTHIRKDEKIGRTRLINPGALHRTAQKTVATVDTQTDKVQFHVLS
ncbi:MAG TPA: YfcE family phosphodiesterase [Tepidisphaeraceae bacterium]